jgi:hypothetical protein
VFTVGIKVENRTLPGFVPLPVVASCYRMSPVLNKKRLTFLGLPRNENDVPGWDNAFNEVWFALAEFKFTQIALLV